MRRSSYRGPYGLSVREIEVIAALVDGCHTNKQIGERLEIAPNTARHHISAICDKLGADGRLQAALFAIRNRVVDFEFAPVNPLTKPITCTRAQLAKGGAR